MRWWAIHLYSFIQKVAAITGAIVAIGAFVFAVVLIRDLEAITSSNN